jgi:RNA polymerase sigma factor (sigma-70 family)
MTGVTRILAQIEQGDPQAAETLLPLVYDELRRLAAAKLAHEKPGQTLQATALVHEAYLRLVCGSQTSDVESPTSDHRPLTSAAWDSRGHFFAAAAESMRRILVEAARRKSRRKRGGNLDRQPLEEDAIEAAGIDKDLLELDAALAMLSSAHPRKAELVKLRYFAGLTIEEAAAALGISTTTAERDWSYARAWLFREISKGG